MNRYEYGRRYRSRRRRNKWKQRAGVIAGCLVVAGVLGAGVWFIKGKQSNASDPANVTTLAVQESSASLSGEQGTGEDPAIDETADAGLLLTDPVQKLLQEAEALALGYDYEGAVALLQSDGNLASDPAVQEAAASYTTAMESLVRVPISQITHVFFHSLVVDNSKAFDGDDDEGGYNQVMTTTGEFQKILQTMYDKDYVLVRLHDLAYETTDDSGNPVMKAGDIMLPEGKTPFVMSQDDLCYYPYMTGDGFATRMVVGEDGKPTCEMKLEDGSVSTGAYDLVPILEEFIQEHPDFSYKGARAVLAFTGYEGILGYRTSSAYTDSPTYEQDRQEAAKVAQCLRDNGWELASHSWGHLNLGTVEWERFQKDTDKWEAEVESLIGPTDIILYPFGADIGDWHPYSMENDRYHYLHSVGFRYFCNVDSNQYWVQLGDDFLRQGRRNLDGYRMWKDITAEDPSHRKLDDLFRAEDVFDPDRPTPVPEM